MSEWSDRFKNSLVWKALDDLGPALDAADQREEVGPPSIEALGRLRAVLTYIGKRLAASDPLLVHPGPVDTIGSHLQNATNEVQQFTANGSHGHLVNANSQADSALGYLSQLCSPLTAGDIQALQSAAERYRQSLEASAKAAAEAVAAVRNDSRELRSKLAELSQEMTAERQRLSSVTSEFQRQFSVAQESRNTEYTSAQATRQSTFAELVANGKDALDRQDAEFTKDRERMSREQADALAGLQREHADKAAGILAAIERHREDVEKLVGVIGNLGVTSGYQTAAREAKITVRVWQGITVAAMVTLIVVAYRIFVPLSLGEFDWQAFAGRVFFTLSIGVLAAYGASQADKYMKAERRNRTLALELEAIGPYLAPLPADQQMEFRLKIGDRTFGHGPETGGDARSPATLIDVLAKSKELRAFITEIVKAARS
jgi:hypothetical protein